MTEACVFVRATGGVRISLYDEVMDTPPCTGDGRERRLSEIPSHVGVEGGVPLESPYWETEKGACSFLYLPLICIIHSLISLSCTCSYLSQVYI